MLWQTLKLKNIEYMATRAYRSHYTWLQWSVKLASAAPHHHSYTSNYPPTTADLLAALFK